MFFRNEHPLLYVGTKRHARIKEGIATQERKLLQPLIAFDADQDLRVGVRFFEDDDPGKAEAEWMHCPWPQDVIHIYRGFRFLEIAPFFTRTGVEELILTPNKKFPTPERIRVTGNLVGWVEYDVIMRELPERLLEALRIIKEKKGKLDVEGLEREMRDGTLAWSPELGRLGVEKTHMVDAREQRKETLWAPYVPYFTGVCEFLDLPNREFYLAQFRTRALEACVRGQSDPSIVVGMTLVNYAKEGAPEMLLAKLFGMKPGAVRLDERAMFVICHILTQVVEPQRSSRQRSVDELRMILRDMQGRWQSMPRSETL